MANNRIQTSALDFDEIKANFKEFLKGQEEFTDFNFEGSGLSILLDILAYNTHYNALYTNLAVNESFLDSASKRESVVSKAKELGYIPTSVKSATARLNVTMQYISSDPPAPDFLEIPRYAPFNTSINGKAYTFYTTDSYIAFRLTDSPTYVFNDVIIKEGKQLVLRETYSGRNTFKLSNPNVDIDSLRVFVQKNSQSSEIEIYSRSDTILDIDSNSRVYYIKELDNLQYEVQFGNGVIGKQLTPGNVITIEYFTSNGFEANNARSFTYAGGLTNVKVYPVTQDIAYGGAFPEAVEDIRWNAPRAYAAQNRCVTLDDYRVIVSSLYPNAESINVWGGEENVPPSYGDIFIAVKPANANTLSEAEKSAVLNDIIAPRRVATMHPKIVDPEYIYVQLDTTYYYNRVITNKTATDLTNLVRQSIEDYNLNNLNRFDGILKYSVLSRNIDESDPAIISSITTLKLHKEIDPQYNRVFDYIINLGNPIYNSGIPGESILSNGINVLNVSNVCYIDDIPNQNTNTGTLRLFYYSGEDKIPASKDSIGTVNYTTGLITIKNLIITGTTDLTFKLVIKPQSNDVVSIRNQIVAIRPELTAISALPEGNINSYRFTSSRN
jgi:hypothetical protein